MTKSLKLHILESTTLLITKQETFLLLELPTSCISNKKPQFHSHHVRDGIKLEYLLMIYSAYHILFIIKNILYNKSRLASIGHCHPHTFLSLVQTMSSFSRSMYPQRGHPSAGSPNTWPPLQPLPPEAPMHREQQSRLVPPHKTP